MTATGTAISTSNPKNPTNSAGTPTPSSNGQAGSNSNPSGTNPAGQSNPTTINLNNLGLQGSLSTNSIGKTDITQLTKSLNNYGSSTSPPGTNTSGSNSGQQPNQGSTTGGQQGGTGTPTNNNVNPMGLANTLTQITSKNYFYC